MNKTMTIRFALTCVLAGAVFGAEAATQSFSWFYDPGASGGNQSSASAWDTSISSLTIKNQPTAWANTGGPGYGTATNKFEAQNLQNSGDYALRVLTVNGGLTETGSSPNHAMDNSGAQEFILFEFSQAVALTELAIGWPDTGSTCAGNTNSVCDTDMSVYAYTAGGGVVAPVMTNFDPSTGASGLTAANGWGFHSDIANVPPDPSGAPPYGPITSINNTTGVASKYWLVGAYNIFGGGSLNTTASYSDYVKLAALGGTITTNGSAPEPGSLSLVGLGLAGVLRRWKRKKSD